MTVERGTSRRLRVLIVPDSIYWVTGTIARSVAAANPWIDATILSGPVLEGMFRDDSTLPARFDLAHFVCPYASRDWLPRLQSSMPVVTSHHHVTSWDLVRHNIDGDAIIAGSDEWVSDLRSRGADMTRVFQMPYGVDVDQFVPPGAGQREAVRRRLGLMDAGPVIGFFAKKASNDDDRKGTDIFAEALTRLHAKLPNTGVLIVGPGWQDLVGSFREQGIRCAWLPFVEDMSGIPPLYHALDFYWVTARVEGGPVPLLEAMSSEVCCLSTSVGLALEVVRDGINAVLLPMDDATAFADETAALFYDDDRRQRIASAGRETMLAEMQSAIHARRVHDVYSRAAESFAKRNPGARVVEIPPAGDRPLSARPADAIPRAALTRHEAKRAEMLEALAWTENLILYQRQKAAGFRLALKAWRANPRSLEPPRIILRRLLPEALVRSIVGVKRRILGGSDGAMLRAGR